MSDFTLELLLFYLTLMDIARRLGFSDLISHIIYHIHRDTVMSFGINQKTRRRIYDQVKEKEGNFSSKVNCIVQYSVAIQGFKMR